MSYTTPLQMLHIAGAIKNYINNKTTGTGGGNTAQAVDSLYAGVLTNPETGEPFFLSDLIDCAGEEIESSNIFYKGEQPEYENITDLQNKIIILTDTIFNLCKKPGNRLSPVIVAIPFIDAGFSIPNYNGFDNKVKESEDFQFANNNALWMIIPHSLGSVSMFAISPHFVINPKIEILVSPEWDYWESMNAQTRGMTGIDDTLSLSYIHIKRLDNWAGTSPNNEELYRRLYIISNLNTKPLINTLGILPYDECDSLFWPKLEFETKNNVTREEIQQTYDRSIEAQTQCAILNQRIDEIKKHIGME